MKRSIWTSNELLFTALIVGVILGHLASLGDIAFQPPFGTVASLVLVLILCAIVSAIRAHGDAERGKRPVTKADPPGSDAAPASAGTESMPSPCGFEEAVEILSHRYGLSAREREVLALLAQGNSAADLQKILVVSMNTVKTHMRHIYAKLGVHSSKELHDKIDAVQNGESEA